MEEGKERLINSSTAGTAMINRTHSLEEVPSISRQVGWDVEFSMKDLFNGSLPVLGTERRLSRGVVQLLV